LGLLKSKEFGVEILSPPRDAFEMTPDVCLVPGLGFSRLGERLGRGKGFYDRFLSRFEGIKIGLSFNEQIMEEIPVEAHDVLLDFLVGEETIYQQGKPYKFWSQTKDT
jgi:5-formyltetrahydrofolate cyclo-ligase